MLHIGGDSFDLEHLHSAPNAPDYGVLLVATEVMLEAFAQQGRNRYQTLLDVFTDALRVLLLLDLGQMCLMFKQLCRQGLDRRHAIDQSGRRSAPRHPAHRRLVKLRLSERVSAIFLDRLDAQGAIAADAAQNDGEGTILLIFSERSEKSIDRSPVLSR